MKSEPVADRPLNKTAVFWLTLSAAATILLTYLFVFASVLFLFLMLGIFLAVFVVLIRFGAAGLVAASLGDCLELLKIHINGIWLRKGSELRVALQPGDAPRLFTMLDILCRRVQISMPREIVLQMNTNAWVRLRGYRQGAGTTILGIGYDLLTGLSEAEVEAVLAHEITHAKLVQRGFKHWVGSGLSRIARVAGGLWAYIDIRRRAKRSCEMASILFSYADALVRRTARLVAAYSRQDEFAADRGAAELCGSGPIRSSLIKLEALAKIASRLPWNERVAQLQTGEGYSRWLIKELSLVGPNPSAETTPGGGCFNQYATHPSLNDRLAALPAAEIQTRDDSPRGIGLLANPDQTAERLVTEIQRFAAEQELKDSKRLRRWNRKLHAGARLRPLQGVGLLMVTLGIIFGAAIWASVGWSADWVIIISAVIGLGAAFYPLGKYRDELLLAVPDYAVLKEAWQKKIEVHDAQLKAIEAELKTSVAGRKPGKRGAMILAPQIYNALGRCDYLRAQVAANLSLQMAPKSVAGLVGIAVSAAALRQPQRVNAALTALNRIAGLSSPSLSWGAAWSLFLSGDWVKSEALLEQALRSRPGNPTLLALVAVCQSQRGKLQSAIKSARQVCMPQPPNKEYVKLLADLLLRGGYLREVEEELAGLKSQWQADHELILLIIRLRLLKQDHAGAEEWSARLQQSAAGAHRLVRLAEIYESARKYGQAAAFYREALAAAHYPEALLGLARLELFHENKAAARRHLLDALNTTKTAGEKSAGTVGLFQAIINQLLLLRDPAPDCQAWVARFGKSAKPPALANASLLVFATTANQAEKFIAELVDALQPGEPSVMQQALTWQKAPPERQPRAPVHPGIQGVFV
jgi:Zn-dependent protease with chaperone function/tetratricopeptide (TPR) repeat protein